MAGVCAGVGPRGVHVRTGVMDTGLGEVLSRICVVGTMATLGVSAVGVSFGTLGEGAGQCVWNMTAGEGCGDFIAGDVGGLAVTLEKMRESVWMAAN